ncbi:VPLPA-CTERM sorting domain-containing protein [Methylomonas sp. SURF-2]|uniref:VPLPA-CTERM sorting domain-containing protein n=1 Tax=Methylomonas subterranea TaxID=2952225 RepID=A0ABT1TKH7_9GAMM|nr:VPLPA-CTERM sorting domain-containing protein [Methylomonas sp. SURF-2]MCQ8105721.1 VPLPA-CTERM sorting domain-containing protein [Methylomonas sp. SURF-2]
MHNHNLKIARLLLGAAGIIGANAAMASTVFGTLSNFDVFNDSSTNSYYGFEIELEGIDSSAIANYNGNYYTFYNWHYGSGQVSTANGKTIVRYYDGGTNNTAPYTAPITNISGHSCITIEGCEHFGLALNGSPTASRYYWLDQAGNRSTAVNLIGAPIINVVQPEPPVPGAPAPAPQVQFVMEAPEAPEVPNANQKFSDAVWVKVIKTELDLEHMANLNDLMADNPDKIADAQNDGVEVEWKLLQRRLKDPDGVNNKLDSGLQAAGANAEQVLRTYQFFAFTGTYDEEHEAKCVKTGSCEDDLQADPNNVALYVGRLLGQQMVAANLNGPIVFPGQVPLPGAAWLFGSVLAGFIGMSRRK